MKLNDVFQIIKKFLRISLRTDRLLNSHAVYMKKRSDFIKLVTKEFPTSKERRIALIYNLYAIMVYEDKLKIC